MCNCVWGGDLWGLKVHRTVVYQPFKVNLHHLIQFRNLWSANLVTHRSNTRTNESRELRRVDSGGVHENVGGSE